MGGSHTGKTFLVRNMIFRQDFDATKKELEIIAASPIQASLDQPIWKDLKVRGFDVKATFIPKTGIPDSITAKTTKKKLIILDDVDHIADIKNGRAWLLNLFGTESHHSNISVVLITHHLRFGSPAIINSANAVIVTGLAPNYLDDAFKTLGLTKDEQDVAREALSDPAGKIKTENNSYVSLFNHVVVWMHPLYEIKKVDGVETSVPEPRLYKYPRDASRALPLQPI